MNKITFTNDTAMACCGLLCIQNMEQAWYGSWRESSIKRGVDVFDTDREAFTDFLTRVDRVVEEHTEEFNDERDGDEKQDYCYGALCMTLTTQQIPGLIDFLKEKGWDETARFKNPKTDNECVTLFYNLA